jgi:glyoxylase-like metal-dependent hydrolase (beta-lactamase superfamily II)
MARSSLLIPQGFQELRKLRSVAMAIRDTYTVTALLDVNAIQDVDDRAESRTYIVADRESGKAVIIDAVLENVDRDLATLQELGLTLVFAVETHIHADHITGASMIKDRTDAQIVYGGGAEGVVTGADLFLYDGQKLHFGNTALKALATPGHTDSCTSYLLPGAVFTGDTMFIRGNGRTDFQGGSAEKLFDSVHRKLFVLPDDTIVYPGHDYNGRVSSTIGEEKKFNERLNLSITKDTFVEIMKNRITPRPAKMDIAIPANMRAGRMVEKETMINQSATLHVGENSRA